MHKGRQIAKKMGITITGTVGILIQSSKEGFLTKKDIEAFIGRLKENDIRISESLYQKLMESMR